MAFTTDSYQIEVISVISTCFDVGGLYFSGRKYESSGKLSTVLMEGGNNEKKVVMFDSWNRGRF